jgi:hypothetical protein
MIDDVECGAVVEIRIDREDRSTQWKPVPVPLMNQKLHMT